MPHELDANVVFYPKHLSDPKHLAFVLARYHFVARMLHGLRSVVEVGCGSMVGAPIIRAAVGDYVGLDREAGLTNEPYLVADILDGRCRKLLGTGYDAVFALDVLEHIERAREERFFQQINWLLAEDGVVIIGTPSQESQPHASQLSRRYHVNCKTEYELRHTLGLHYNNVFLFGMNDTTLHTGFGPMCHYRLAICCGART